MHMNNFIKHKQVSLFIKHLELISGIKNFIENGANYTLMNELLGSIKEK